MSVNPEPMEVSTDYSDFEYQQIDSVLLINEGQDNTGDENARVLSVTSVEPLLGRGGLDNNEVAELVYMQTSAYIEIEDDSGDQDVGTAAEGRGTVGINLPNSTDAFVQDEGQFVDGNIVGEVRNVDEGNVTVGTSVVSDNRILQLFDTHATYPFDDASSGPGGGGSQEGYTAEKNWRQLTGRGPVVDATDDISTALALNAGDTILTQNLRVRVHMVWDVAEVSDAGRAFSVPM